MRTTHINAVNQACGDLISTLHKLIAEHRHQIDQAERLIPLVEQLQADKPAPDQLTATEVRERLASREHKPGGITPIDSKGELERRAGIKAVAKSLDVEP